jgi:hypothetical protein
MTLPTSYDTLLHEDAPELPDMTRAERRAFAYVDRMEISQVRIIAGVRVVRVQARRYAINGEVYGANGNASMARVVLHVARLVLEAARAVAA